MSTVWKGIEPNKSETIVIEDFSDRSDSGSCGGNYTGSDNQLVYGPPIIRRIHLNENSKQVCVNVYKNLLKRKNASMSCNTSSNSSIINEAAFLTEIPKSTLHKLVSKGITKRKKRSDLGKPGKSKHSFIGESIEAIIKDTYEKGIHWNNMDESNDTQSSEQSTRSNNETKGNNRNKSPKKDTDERKRKKAAWAKKYRAKKKKDSHKMDLDSGDLSEAVEKNQTKLTKTEYLKNYRKKQKMDTESANRTKELSKIRSRNYRKNKMAKDLLADIDNSQVAGTSTTVVPILPTKRKIIHSSQIAGPSTTEVPILPRNITN